MIGNCPRASLLARGTARSRDKPGSRSRCWWKAKNRLTLTVEVLDCAPELVGWGDWGKRA